MIHKYQYPVDRNYLKLTTFQKKKCLNMTSVTLLLKEKMTLRTIKNQFTIGAQNGFEL